MTRRAIVRWRHDLRARPWPYPHPQEGQVALEEALYVARRQQARAYELRAATSLARLWRDQGRREEARELIAPVYGWLIEGFVTRDLKEAKALLEGRPTQGTRETGAAACPRHAHRRPRGRPDSGGVNLVLSLRKSDPVSPAR
jgi:hypothetical protein